MLGVFRSGVVPRSGAFSDHSRQWCPVLAPIPSYLRGFDYRHKCVGALTAQSQSPVARMALEHEFSKQLTAFWVRHVVLQ